MYQDHYHVGELVVITRGDWQGYSGVVSWPITQDEPGYVLIYSEGNIAGVQANYPDVKPADESSQGYTQLTYHLIKLSSYLIERAIL